MAITARSDEHQRTACMRVYVCVCVRVCACGFFTQIVLCATAWDGNTLYRHSAARGYKADVPRACTRSRILPHRNMRGHWVGVRDRRHIGGSS